MPARRYAAAALAAAALCAGCSGASTASDPRPTATVTVTASPHATPESTASPTPTPTLSAALNAKTLAQALTAKIPTMKLTKVYTERSDPNNLMGRPGGYTSKIAFSDSRVSTSDTAGTEADALERGGSIEVYATRTQAKKRSDYIQAILSGGGILGTEYDYLSGGMLVRVNGTLIPKDAKTYQRALQEIAP
jgi:hypothetical protein